MLPIIEFKKVTSEIIYNITLESTKASQVFIYEIGSLEKFITKKQSEELRGLFIENNVKVKQLSNNKTIDSFSQNTVFIEKVMKIRYLPESTYSIKHEMCMFDGKVAIYNSEEYAIIENADFFTSQKQLFKHMWETAGSPIMGFEYLPSESLYDNIYYEDQKIIVWPDLDSVDSYSGMNKKEILDYIQGIIDGHKSYYEDAGYLITFIWSNNGKKMIDIWKYTENPVDDRSGPLSDVVVYEDGKPCHGMGIASGNTLFVLGYEEKLRRQSSSLEEYLAGPAPTLPLDIINGKNFFDYNKS